MATPFQWPQGFDPDHSPVHARSESQIAAPVEVVWDRLVRAPEWHTWNRSIRRAELLGSAHGGERLTAGTRFRWRHNLARLESTVREYESSRLIAWDARGIGVAAYVTWLLTPTAAGVHVAMEQTQRGVAARLNHLACPKILWRHQNWWLTALSYLCERGEPLPPWA